MSMRVEKNVGYEVLRKRFGACASFMLLSRFGVVGFMSVRRLNSVSNGVLTQFLDAVMKFRGYLRLVHNVLQRSNCIEKYEVHPDITTVDVFRDGHFCGLVPREVEVVFVRGGREFRVLNIGGGWCCVEVGSKKYFVSAGSVLELLSLFFGEP